MKKYYSVCISALVFTVLPVFIYAQSKDSVHTLNTVNISGNRIDNFAIGIKVTKFDSACLSDSKSETVAGFLTEQSYAYVKSYGNGSLANISVRGSGSNQVGVFWNGFLISPPNISITDASLLPVFFFDDVELQYGGASSLFGNGIIGGSLHLVNNPHFEKSFNVGINYGIGSFRQQDYHAKVTTGSEKIYSSTAILCHQAQNDFSYIDISDFNKPKLTQINAALDQHGFMQEIFLKIKKNQVLNANFWYNNSYREIPGTMTTGKGRAYQEDESSRNTLSWQISDPKNLLQIKSAYFKDHLHFVDTAYSVNSKLTTQVIMGEAEWKKFINRSLRMNAGINTTLNIADIQAYQGVKTQKEIRVFLSVVKDLFKNRLSINGGVRQEFIEGYKVPFAPMLGVEYRILKFLQLKSNISGNFRAPSMNDRYWQPGGNENLKPETGVSEDFGLIFNTDKKGIINKSEISFTYFNSRTNNRIVWYPESPSYWTPRNLYQVLSRGFESKASFKLSFKKWTFSFNGNYSYTLSTNEKTYASSDEILGKQLIYVPVHNGFAQIKIDRKIFFISYNQSYTGYRFANSDNSKELPEYTLGNAKAGFKYRIYPCMINLQFSVNNIWDISYYAIEYRPMPGRYYLITFTLNFNEPFINSKN
ncbi:MAG: TonB-dependent receptor [Bacteroidales bacterium]